MLGDAVKGFWWNEDSVRQMEDAIVDDTVLELETGESIDFDVDNAAKAGNVDAEGFIFQKSGKVDL